MRVISGKAGGLRLNSLKGLATRPTADRIKESLFNIINPFISNAEVLDLFAGTGALGIEALSRGAKAATFIDKCRDSIALIKSNLEHTGLSQISEVYLLDYETAIKKLSGLGKRYNIVFIDPPYSKGMELKAVELLLQCGLAATDCMLIIETEQKLSLPEKLFGATRVDKREYGRTAISFYRVGC